MGSCNQTNDSGRPLAELPQGIEYVIDGGPPTISQEVVIANDYLNDSSINPFNVMFPEESLMLINDHDTSSLEPTGSTPNYFDPASSSEIGALNTSLRGPDVTETRIAKCRRIVQKDKDDVKRFTHELSLPATLSSGPFRTLRITKPSTARDRWSLQKSEKDELNLSDGISSQGARPRHPRGQTTMEQLTPYPTGRLQESGLNEMSCPLPAGGHQPTPATSAYGPWSTSYDEPGGAIVVAQQPTNRAYTPGPNYVEFRRADEFASIGTVPHRLRDDSGTSNDEYPLDDDLMEEDIASLLNIGPDKVQETHIPPSSVTQAWDHDSRSAAEYDRTLQYSSPSPSSGQPRVSQPVGEARHVGDSQDELLDDDVDWNAVYAMVSVLPRASSAAGPQDMVRPSAEDQTFHAEKTAKHDPRIKDAMFLKPFVRSSFPERVPDRCTVPGLSSNTVLRTCFRIGEMVNQAARCLNHQQEVVFELFARVTYSNRESLERRQHFQFIDLFKDQRPYPTGILANWRVGSLIDRQSSAFVGISTGPQMCRCMCKPRREPKAPIGLSLVVLAIKEVDWTQVRLAKKIACGGSDDAT
ncbi:hypothetical protein GGS26DRAFT_594352 [Hypomontagnella submonticulosa]|nr:hypothetical protein GGS26DRAFT_594352 [Hypomontagnella submonticulosa]